VIGRGDVGVLSLRLTRLRVIVLVACLAGFAVTFAQPAAADSGSGSTTTASSDPSTGSGTADSTTTDSSSTATGSAATTTDPSAPAATDATASDPTATPAPSGTDPATTLIGDQASLGGSIAGQRRSSRCLHFTHRVALGKACSLALPIGSPHDSHDP